MRGITAAGGWCAPRETLYDMPPARLTDAIKAPPTVRGGISFTVSPEKAAAQWLTLERVRRQAQALAKRRHLAVEGACAVALTHGWDIHVYEPPQPVTESDSRSLAVLAHIGIAFTPAAHAIPTIHQHQYRHDPDWDA